MSKKFPDLIKGRRPQPIRWDDQTEEEKERFLELFRLSLKLQGMTTDDLKQRPN